MKDTFKYVKIVFAFLSLLFFLLLFLPYVVINLVGDGIGKLLKLREITNNIIAALSAILTWVTVFYILLIAFALISNTVSVISTNACVYYSVFMSMLISNKIASIVFFKISKVSDEEKRKLAKHQVTLFWHYTVFVFSFIAKPLNFSDPNVKLFFDALFYSSATLSLLSKAIETKNKSV
ncbi:hypothetical protein D3C76_685440 [compost metagenome]